MNQSERLTAAPFSTRSSRKEDRVYAKTIGHPKNKKRLRATGVLEGNHNLLEGVFQDKVYHRRSSGVKVFEVKFP